MTRRLPGDPAPGPLEGYSARFDDLFDTLAGRQAFRRYLQGLLLPAERNKTLTALANTEPVVGAQRKEAQGLQWFLSESNWSPQEINRRRVDIMLEEPSTAPQAGGALVVDETGDRKDGKATAHVGKQYLGGIGKIDNGVVSVSSLWVDERVYYPLEVEPYTPAHHFEGGKNDPGFRTKPHIAMELVERALEMGLPFRAVVGDILYGEHRKFKEGLEEKRIPYVLSLKPSTHGGIPSMRSAGLREWPRAPTGTVPTIPASGSNSNAASATGTRRRGGLWKPSAGRSLWRRTGGWSWRPPIPPRCRAVPVGTLVP